MDVYWSLPLFTTQSGARLVILTFGPLIHTPTGHAINQFGANDKIALSESRKRPVIRIRQSGNDDANDLPG